MKQVTIYRIFEDKEDAIVLDKRPSFKEAQNIVGGYIQAIPVKGGVIYCNEEGKLMGMPVNKLATARFGSQIYGGILVGNLLFIEGWQGL